MVDDDGRLALSLAGLWRRCAAGSFPSPIQSHGLDRSHRPRNKCDASQMPLVRRQGTYSSSPFELMCAQGMGGVESWVGGPGSIFVFFISFTWPRGQVLEKSTHASGVHV